MMNYYTPVTSYSSCERKEKHGWNDLTLVFSTPIPGLLFCFPHAPRIDDGISYISEGTFLRGMKDLHATQQLFTSIFRRFIRR